MKKYLLMLLTIILVTSACSAKNGGSSASLLGSWKLTSYGTADAQTPAVADVEAGLTFKDDGTLTGNSGCNSFGGNYSVEDGQIKFDQIVSTLMACDDPRMAQEEAVHKVLTDTATFKVEGSTLTLMSAGMALVLTK